MAKSDLGNQNVDTSQRISPGAGVDEYFKNLLEQSSLGSPAARQIREQADRDAVEEVRRRLTTHADRTMRRSPGRLLVSYHQAGQPEPAGRRLRTRRLRLHRSQYRPISHQVVDADGRKTEIPPVESPSTGVIHAAEIGIRFPCERQDKLRYDQSGTGFTLIAGIRKPTPWIFPFGFSEAFRESIEIAVERVFGAGEPSPILSERESVTLESWCFAVRAVPPPRHFSRPAASLWVRHPGIYAVRTDPPRGASRNVFRRLSQNELTILSWYPEMGLEVRKPQVYRYLAMFSGTPFLSFAEFCPDPVMCVSADGLRALSISVGRDISRLARGRVLREIVQNIPAEAVISEARILAVWQGAWILPYDIEIVNDPRSGIRSLWRPGDIRLWPARKYVTDACFCTGSNTGLAQPWHLADAGGMPGMGGPAQGLAGLQLRRAGELLALCAFPRRGQPVPAEEFIPASVKFWFRHAETDDTDSGSVLVSGTPGPGSPGKIAASVEADFAFTAQAEAAVAASGPQMGQDPASDAGTSGHTAAATYWEFLCPPLEAAELSVAEAEHMASIFRALADPVRLRLFSRVAANQGGEASVCDLQNAGVSQPAVSNHLKKLRQAGLIISERRGNWVYCRVAPGALSAMARMLDPEASHHPGTGDWGDAYVRQIAAADDPEHRRGLAVGSASTRARVRPGPA